MLQSPNSEIKENNWHHIAFSYDENGVNLYIDGVLSSSNLDVNVDTTVTSLQNMVLGSNIDGLVDNVKIFDSALSQSEIQHLAFSGNYDLALSDKVTELKFNEFESVPKVLKNESGQDATISGSPLYTSGFVEGSKALVMNQADISLNDTIPLGELSMSAWVNLDNLTSGENLIVGNDKVRFYLNNGEIKLKLNGSDITFTDSTGGVVSLKGERFNLNFNAANDLDTSPDAATNNKDLVTTTVNNGSFSNDVLSYPNASFYADKLTLSSWVKTNASGTIFDLGSLDVSVNNDKLDVSIAKFSDVKKTYRKFDTNVDSITNNNSVSGIVGTSYNGILMATDSIDFTVNTSSLTKLMPRRVSFFAPLRNYAPKRVIISGVSDGTETELLNEVLTFRSNRYPYKYDITAAETEYDSLRVKFDGSGPVKVSNIEMFGINYSYSIAYTGQTEDVSSIAQSETLITPNPTGTNTFTDAEALTAYNNSEYIESVSFSSKYPNDLSKVERIFNGVTNNYNDGWFGAVNTNTFTVTVQFKQDVDISKIIIHDSSLWQISTIELEISTDGTNYTSLSHVHTLGNGQSGPNTLENAKSANPFITEQEAKNILTIDTVNTTRYLKIKAPHFTGRWEHGGLSELYIYTRAGDILTKDGDKLTINLNAGVTVSAKVYNITANTTTEIQNVSNGFTIGLDSGNVGDEFFVELTASGTTYTSNKVTVSDVTPTSSESEIVAFHHGNFDNVYGDGTKEDAATNGHVYADTPTGNYSWGTLDSVTTSSTGTTYTWTPTGELTADVLMVAGGGGGGGMIGGGGGAGGLLLFDSATITNDQKTITVGNGSSGGVGWNNGSNEGGYKGNDTTFTTFETAIGGGAGRGYMGSRISPDGGSGGGSALNHNGENSTPGTREPGKATSGQGYDGGPANSDNPHQPGGGGGGAGGAGINSTSGSHGGLGKDLSETFGTTYGDSGYFASGGGGGNWHGTAGTAYQGGGGNGTNSTSKAGDGQKHTGGGGGAAGYSDLTSNSTLGGSGGSGIVIIKYMISNTPKLTFDTFNKLTVENITGTPTKINLIFTPDGSTTPQTIDVGTATTITISQKGKYKAQIVTDTGISTTAEITVISVSSLSEPANPVARINFDDAIQLDSTYGMTIEQELYQEETSIVHGGSKSGHFRNGQTDKIALSGFKNGDFTISFWMNITSQSTSNIVFGTNDGTYDDTTVNGIALHLHTHTDPTKYRFDLYAFTGGSWGYATPKVDADMKYGEWVHVVVTSTDYYVNGVKKTEATPTGYYTSWGAAVTGELQATQYLVFGAVRKDHLTQKMNGYLDDILVYDRVLTDDEILFLSSGGPTTFTFDGNNKLTIENPPVNATTTLKFTPTDSTDTQEIDIGTATSISISATGTYSAMIKSADSFTFSDEVTINTVTILPEQNKYEFSYTGSDQTFEMNGLTTITAELWGASGSSVTGRGPETYGGYSKATITVPSGVNELKVIVGEYYKGINRGAYGGGGTWSTGNTGVGGGSGGGRSAIQMNNEDIITAGGGGGARGKHNSAQTVTQSNGGGLQGSAADGQALGSPGTQSAGGAGAGSGQFGNGSSGGKYVGGSSTGEGSSGGGGWFGGGGAKGIYDHHGSGGGGSGFVGRDGSAYLTGVERGSWNTHADTTPRTDTVNNCIYENTKCIQGQNVDHSSNNYGNLGHHGHCIITTSISPPALSFDNINKLTIENPPANATTTLKFTPTGSADTKTFDIGTASSINIAEPGTYSALINTTDSFIFTNEVIVTNVIPYENPYRSINELDTSIAHEGGAFNSTTIAFWAKTDVPYSENINAGRGPILLSPSETERTFVTFGALNILTTNRISGYSGCSNNSKYQFYGATPPDGFDPLVWNYFIFYTPNSSNSTSRLYLPAFNYSTTDTNICTLTNSYLGIAFNTTHKLYITDLSIYNAELNATQRATLYNNGNIGGAANLSTNRIHYFRFNSNNLRLNEGTSADIPSSALIETSTDIPPAGTPPPSLTFDNYNKLTIENPPVNATTTLKFTPTDSTDTQTFDIGTASSINIAEPGTYSALINTTDSFIFTNEVTVTTIQTPPKSGPYAYSFSLANSQISEMGPYVSEIDIFDKDGNQLQYNSSDFKYGNGASGNISANNNNTTSWIEDMRDRGILGTGDDFVGRYPGKSATTVGTELFTMSNMSTEIKKIRIYYRGEGFGRIPNFTITENETDVGTVTATENPNYKDYEWELPSSPSVPLVFSNDKLILSGLPSDHTETIIEKKDGASVNVGKATEVVLSEPGEYKAIIKSPTEWTFTEYVNVEAIGNVTTYLNGLTTHMISPQSGEQYMKSITFMGSWTSDIQGTFGKYPMVPDVPVTWNTTDDHPFIVTDMGIFKNDTAGKLALGGGMLSGGLTLTNNEYTTIETRNVLIEMGSNTYVTTMTMYDGRKDWTYNSYEIWVGTDKNNLSYVATTSSTPTQEWSPGGTTSASTTTINQVVKYIEIRKWKVRTPSTSGSNSVAGLGIGELYIYGKKATII